MFDFGIFCHLLRLLGIYRVEAPVRVFEKYLSLFSFLPFLFFLFFFFILHFLFSLSLGAPLAPGPLDIVHHATQSLRHCTAHLLTQETRSLSGTLQNTRCMLLQREIHSKSNPTIIDPYCIKGSRMGHYVKVSLWGCLTLLINTRFRLFYFRISNC